MMHRELWTLYPDVFIQSRDSITRFQKYIFIFTPENVDISGDPLGLDGSSAKMPTINREF